MKLWILWKKSDEKSSCKKKYIPNSNFWTWIQFKWSQIHKIKHKFWFWHPKPTNLAHISHEMLKYVIIIWTLIIRRLSYLFFVQFPLYIYLVRRTAKSFFSPFFLNAAWKIFILWHRRNEPMIYGLRIESETSMSIFYGRGLPITSLR